MNESINISRNEIVVCIPLQQACTWFMIQLNKPNYYPFATTRLVTDNNNCVCIIYVQLTSLANKCQNRHFVISLLFFFFCRPLTVNAKATAKETTMIVCYECDRDVWERETWGGESVMCTMTSAQNQFHPAHRLFFMCWLINFFTALPSFR